VRGVRGEYGSARGADTLNASGEECAAPLRWALRILPRPGTESRVCACVSANHKFLIRQAAQLQREAGSARLRSGGRAALVDPQAPGRHGACSSLLPG
jgi:hypothetical protein